MNIVLDSNVLVSALGKRSRLRPIWNAFLDDRYQLIISEDILKEYQEITTQHSAPGVANIISEIFFESTHVVFQTVFYNWNAILSDPDDNKFFDIAVAAGADYLVTNDRHFNPVKKLVFPKVHIITAEAFLNILIGNYYGCPD